MNDATIGIQIKKARAEAQLTQSELGKKINVTWEMISRYENGKSSPRKNLERIAKALGKPIQYFFGVEEMPIRDEIKRLSELLSRKGAEFEKVKDVPYLPALKKGNISKQIRSTTETYASPAWILGRFKDVFACKLTGVTAEGIDVSRKDVGYFSESAKPRVGFNYVLTREKGAFVIVKYTRKVNNLAMLIAIERRFV